MKILSGEFIKIKNWLLDSKFLLKGKANVLVYLL